MSTSTLVFALLGIGFQELILILLVLLLLFGGSKLPSLARGLGQSVKEFKKASREEDETAKPAADGQKTDTTKTPTGSK